MPKALAPKRSVSSALQASQVPAVPGEEDLDDDEEEDDEDEEDNFLAAGSQVSCLLVWSPVDQAGFPQRACHLLSQRPPVAGQWHCGPQAKPRL